MRLKLVLKIVEGTVLPCNYMYEMSSCLYMGHRTKRILRVGRKRHQTY